MTKEEIVTLLNGNQDAITALDSIIGGEVSTAVTLEKQQSLNAINKIESEKIKLKNELDNTKATLKAKSKDADESINDATGTISALSERLQRMEDREKQLGDLSKARDEQLIITTLESKLSNEFTGVGMLAKQLLSDGSAKINESGVVTLVDGENVIAWDDGITKLKEKYSDIVKVTQVGGLGGGRGEGRPPIEGKSTLDLMRSVSRM